MDSVVAFFEQNIVVVYFFYGLAFFSMGVAVWLESGRASELPLARAMGPLAAFGILHGLHEWLEMFQHLGALVPEAPALSQTIVFDGVRVGLLAASFILLIVFGVRLIHFSGRGRGSERTFVLLSTGTLVLIWAVSSVATQRVYALCAADCLLAIDVLSRYILGIPGALLAGWAMLLEQRAFRERGMVAFGRDLQWAALALFLYGIVGQSFPARSVLFPATVVNSELFLKFFGFPIQFFRAVMATVVAIFVIQALRAFELERRQRLQAANEARLTAQQEALETQRRAREQSEKLNRELQLMVQDLTLLFELSRTVATTLDRSALLHKALEKVLSSIPRLQAGMILLCDAPGGTPEVVARLGCDAETGAGVGLLVCQQMRRLGEYVVAHAAPALCCGDEQPVALAIGTHSRPLPVHDVLAEQGRIVGVPLWVQDQVRGSLVLGTRPGTSPLTVRDLSLLSTVAGQVSMAVENATLYEEVQGREALLTELLQRIVGAQERERQRIARELHDGTGQVLTGLGLGLKAVAATVHVDPELASRQLLELKDLSAQALQELHDLIGDLRPSVLDDLGLVPALHGHVQAFAMRSGVQAAFEASGRRRRLPPQLETVIFRIAQEALTNVAKHAAAEHAMVRLIFDDEAVQLVVTDDGHGFDPRQALDPGNTQRRAWGLLGMQERVTLVGGACEIVSQPGTGTTVRVYAPVPEGKKNGEIKAPVDDPVDVSG